MLRDLLAKFWLYLIQLNLFPTRSSITNPAELQTQRIASRLFIIIFSLSACFLFVYTVSATSIRTFTISTPTLKQYAQLYQSDSQTLSCPCSQISNNYSSFIQIDYYSHPVCSSIFITNPWITYVRLYSGVLRVDDFRFTARHTFQALRSLCQLTKESIQISLDQFYSTKHVTNVLSSEDLLRSQSEAIIKQFITATTNNFLLSLRLIGNTTQANTLASGLLTNLGFYIPNREIIIPYWTRRDTCNCQTTSACTQQIVIYPNGNRTSSWDVPGFSLGCFVLEALRQSDLNCFFNQTCLEDFQSHLQTDRIWQLTALDSALLQRFDASTRVEQMINALMVDEWTWAVSHAKYFEGCQPKECSYTRISRESWTNIVTKLVGMIGGLITALKLIVPRVVQLFQWSFSRRSTSQPGNYSRISLS